MQNYSLGLVPEWCGKPPNDHQDNLGGCWGISHGFVQRQGESYCKGCDEYRGADEPKVVVQEN